MTSSATDAAAALFGGAGSLLAATLDPALGDDAGDAVALGDGVEARRLGRGVVEVRVRGSLGPAVLSAGVHGDETAPVEILDGLLTGIVAGRVVPRRDLLLVLANPPALRRQTRFVAENMNRLFVDADPESSDGEERRRARLLMAQVTAFLDGAGGEPVHLDLHTAIRGSRYRRFAICPDGEDSNARRRALARLGAWGIEAVVISTGTRSTFSAWSQAACGSRSFTLELGSVRPFGENDLDSFRAFSDGLAAWLQGGVDAPDPPPVPRIFRATREIRRRHDDFRLLFPDDVENFTPFETGAAIAEDGGEVIRAAAGEHVLFPNAAVAVGQRALLLAAPVD